MTDAAHELSTGARMRRDGMAEYRRPAGLVVQLIYIISDRRRASGWSGTAEIWRRGKRTRQAGRTTD
jgi:hypothetical protein